MKKVLVRWNPETPILFKKMGLLEENEEFESCLDALVAGLEMKGATYEILAPIGSLKGCKSITIAYDGVYEKYNLVPVFPQKAPHVLLFERHPVAKGIHLDVIGPEGLDPLRPFRGEIFDIGIEGHTRIWRVILNEEAPWCVVSHGEGLEGAVEDLRQYMEGGSDPRTWKVFYLREGGLIREYGYKRRTSVDFILRGGVLEFATPEETAAGKEPVGGGFHPLKDKLREAGIIP